MTRLEVGGTERIYNEPFVDTGGSLATGLATATGRLTRLDGQYWNGAGYQVAPFDFPMAERDVVGDPGVYEFDLSAVAGQISEEQHLVLIDAGDATVVNRRQRGEVSVGGWLTNLLAIPSSVWAEVVADPGGAGSAAALLQVSRKLLANRVVVNAAGTLVTVYEDDDVTPAFTVALTADRLERSRIG